MMNYAKRTTGFLLGFLLLASTGGCATTSGGDAFAGVDYAICIVSPTSGNSASGTVRFDEIDSGLLITADISGLSPNQAHGFHVHQHGFSGSDDGTCTGGHYDPRETGFHALPGYDGEHHAGDLGVLQADANGRARYRMVFPNLSVAKINAVLGRAIIVHAKPDDGGQPTGNAGKRIGVGNIAVAVRGH